MQSSSNNEIRDYFKILKEDPTSRVFAPLAEALVRRGRLDEAEKICQMGLEANPDFSDGHLAYARVLYYLFRYQEAIQQVKLTLATSSSNVEAYLIAAEVFLARSQHKPASDACLKAIDIDPENVEARQILRRINAQAEEEAQGGGKERPKRESTSKFRATAGTAPSRRIQDPAEKPSSSDPFRQLLQETGKVGAGRLDLVEQPFSAMSPGSYPADDRDFGEADTDDLDEDTAVSERRKEAAAANQEEQVGLKKYRRDGTPIPSLPEHPPGSDDDLLDQVMTADTRPQFEAPAEFVHPKSTTSKPPPPELSRQGSGQPSVEDVQSMIDAYSLRNQSEVYESAPIRMPRSGRLLVILFVLGSLGAIIGLLLLGFSRERNLPDSRDGKAAQATAPVGTSATTDEPIPLPEPEPEETAPSSEPEAAEVASEPPPEEPKPEPVKKAAVKKPRKKKTSRRRRKRRRKKRRKRKKKKRRTRKR